MHETHVPLLDPFPGRTPPWISLAHTPHRTLPDLGPEVLATVASSALSDEPWVTREDRSLLWWPHRFAQRITVSEPRDALDCATVCVRAETTIVEEIPAEMYEESSGRVDEIVTGLGWYFGVGMSAWVSDPEKRTLSLVTTGYAHDGNRPFLSAIATAITAQALEADAYADKCASALGGRPACSQHPQHGRRTEPAAALENLRTLLHLRQAGSAFEGSTWEATTSVPWLLKVDRGGCFVGELPYTGTTPSLSQQLCGEPYVTAVVTLDATAVHPVLGRGMAAELRLPGEDDSEDAANLAAALNRTEATTLTGVPLMGMWWPMPGSGWPLRYSSFIPSILGMPGMAAATAFYLYLRLTWARHHLIDL